MERFVSITTHRPIRLCPVSVSACPDFVLHIPYTGAVLTGARFDDIIPEENDVVQAAIKRLSAKESYDRVFRIRRAFQVRSSRP